MTDISISLNNIQNIKTVNIEGVGIVKVRRLGSGEELDLSSKIRRLGKLIDELSRIDFTVLDANKPEDLAKITKLTRRVEELSDEISAIKESEFEVYKKCFTDDEGGRIVDIIMNTLSEQERAELFRQIFGDVKELDTPDNIVAEVVENDKK